METVHWASWVSLVRYTIILSVWSVAQHFPHTKNLYVKEVRQSELTYNGIHAAPLSACLLLVGISFLVVTCNHNLKTARATAVNLDYTKMEVPSYLDEQAKIVQDVADMKLSVIKFIGDMLAKDQQD